MKASAGPGTTGATGIICLVAGWYKMARGRMLNKSVCGSKKFDDLPDDTCRLLATWCIAHLDIRGVFYANPTMVRSLVFPRRDDVLNAQVAEYMDAIEAVGLIVRFESNGETWQYWAGFEHNQIGIRYDRESSDFPIPPGWTPPKTADFVPPNDGQNPAEVKVKSKVNVKGTRSASADSEPRHPAIDTYHSKARMFPDKVCWPIIEQSVGKDQANLERWGKTVEAYILLGWNKRNVNGMLEFFNRGEMPHLRNDGGNGKHPPDQRDKLAQAEALTRERLKQNGNH